MSQKLAATFHGAPCEGKCCTQLRHLGICAHGYACQHHLREEAARIKEERESSARIEIAKAWDL